MKTKIALLCMVLLVSGCLATTDLAQEPMIPSADRSLLQRIASQAQSACHRVTYDQSGNTTAGSGYKFTQKFNIRRYYISSTDWVKVEAHSSGVWDNIYFNKATNQMVCGQKNWITYSDVAGIAFTEFGKQPKTLGQSSLKEAQDVFQALLLAQNNSGKSWDEIHKQDRSHNLAGFSTTQLCQGFKEKTIEETVVRRELLRRGESGLACDTHQATAAVPSAPKKVIVIAPKKLTQICNDTMVMASAISAIANIQIPNQPTYTTRQINAAVKRLESSLGGYDEDSIAEIMERCN